MNILFVADPNLIHDVRWITLIQAEGNTCYLLPRYRHYVQFTGSKKILQSGIQLLEPIHDPSTIRPFRNLIQAVRIYRIIRKKEIQLFHIMYAEPNALWANWKFLFRIPMILTTLGTDVLLTIPSFSKKTDWLSRVVSNQYRRALNRFDAITCTSGSQKQKISELKITVPVSIIRTGVDFSLLEKTDTTFVRELGLKKPFVLMPRNMKPIYHHEFTLEAISLLGRRFLDKFCFVFTNSDSADKEYLQTILRKASSLAADIRFFPSFRHDEIISLYKEAALVIMNPVSDGSSVSAMEAIACGTPVILPPLDYDREIFETAFFFETWKTDSLKSKIEEVLLMDQETLRKRLIKGARVIALHGDSNREIRKIKMIYQSLLANGVQK